VRTPTPRPCAETPRNPLPAERETQAARTDETNLPGAQPMEKAVQEPSRLFPAFSLSRAPSLCLPVALTSVLDGKLYPIDPDFRTVLACLRVMGDPDRTDLDKLLYLAVRFFLRHPPPDQDQLFAQFATGGRLCGADEPPLIDFETDAGAIYASFRQQYGLNLLRESLHWLEFRELLSGLTEATPLGAHIRLRTLEENRVAPEDRAALRRMKQKVAITPRAGRQEQALLDELNRRLAAGEDPSDIVRQLQEV